MLLFTLGLVNSILPVAQGQSLCFALESVGKARKLLLAKVEKVKLKGLLI